MTNSCVLMKTFHFEETSNLTRRVYSKSHLRNVTEKRGNVSQTKKSKSGWGASISLSSPIRRGSPLAATRNSQSCVSRKSLGSQSQAPCDKRSQTISNWPNLLFKTLDWCSLVQSRRIRLRSLALNNRQHGHMNTTTKFTTQFRMSLIRTCMESTEMCTIYSIGSAMLVAYVMLSSWLAVAFCTHTGK